SASGTSGVAALAGCGTTGSPTGGMVWGAGSGSAGRRAGGPDWVYATPQAATSRAGMSRVRGLTDHLLVGGHERIRTPARASIPARPLGPGGRPRDSTVKGPARLVPIED